MSEENQNNAVSAEESKRVVEANYDKIAQTYLDWTTKSGSPRLQYLEKLLSQIDASSANILELGCGAGVPCTQVFAKRCAKVIANDISEAQIEMAKKNVPGENVQFIKGDMTKLSIEPSSINGVAGFYAIIHLPREEQRTMLSQIRDWLSPGGYLIANFGVKDDPGATRNWLGSQMYWSSFDADTYLKILKETGFDVVEHEILEDDEDGRVVPFLWILARKA